MKAIVIYYSKSGVTKQLAERIAKDIPCNMLRIEPEKDYGSYIGAIIRVAGEKIIKKRPRVTTKIPDLSIYDTVFIGYPIWYSEPPQFVIDFMKECKLVGKTIIPFATAGGNTIDVTLKCIREISDDANVMCPFTWALKQKDDYDKWIEEVRKI